jgi:hypothetical protein
MRFLVLFRVLFSVALCLQSCEYLGYKKPSKEALVKQELAEIDWSTVDSYPSFPSCEPFTGQEAKNCFETTLTNALYEVLSTINIEVSQALNDTVYVEMLIDTSGNIHFLQAIKSNIIAEEIPQLDSVLSNGIASLPKVFPAHKRATPVATKFKLPVLLQVD